MWDFLREQINRFPGPLIPWIAIAFVLAGLNLASGINLPLQIQQCVPKPEVAGCIGLGFAVSPYAALAIGFFYHYIAVRTADMIRRWWGSRRGKKPSDQ